MSKRPPKKISRGTSAQPVVEPGDGYSLLYRIGWEIEYTLLHVFGPASLSREQDPRLAMKRDHDRRRALWLERRAAARSADHG